MSFFQTALLHDPEKESRFLSEPPPAGNPRRSWPGRHAGVLRDPRQIPAGARKILLGYSLGSGVLLDAISGFAVQPDGVTLAAAYTSGRDAAVCLGPLPSWLTWVIPDVYNNVQAVRRLSLPLLIIHSRADRLFPTWMPAKMLAAAAGPKSLVMLEGLEHGDMVDGKAAEYLAPLIESNFPPE